MKKILLLLAFVSTGMLLMATEIKSPNKELVLNVMVKEGAPVYWLTYKNKPVIKESRLGLQLKNDQSLMEGFVISNSFITSFDETWQPVWGEVKSIRNNYNELAVTITQTATQRSIIVRCRLFNDGLGFRYEFPLQEKLNYIIIKEEKTQFALAGDALVFWGL